MKQIILKYGTIIGVLLCIPMFVMTYMMYNKPEVQAPEWLVYFIHAAIMGVTYPGLLSVRKLLQGAGLSFFRAWKNALLMVLVGATIYVLVWLVLYYLFIPDFMEVFRNYFLQHSEPGEREQAVVQVEVFEALYENPLMVILFTYAEVIPSGLIVSILTAALARRKK